ncbi:MAG: ribbon-helix-helix protein, CopG family [Deferribacteres bacterium]|nr:ribbon-helix-helix protein, CopG family [Deferribacteres bacterium]
MGKREIERIGEIIKSKRRTFIDEVAEKAAVKASSPKNKKVTLSLPEDVVRTLWILKAEGGYPSISQIVAEAVREFASKRGLQSR